MRNYTEQVRKEIDSEFCFYCGKKLRSDNKTFDHLIPVAQGGKDVVDNLVCSCIDCNTIKGNNTIPQLLVKLRKETKFCGEGDELRKAKLDYYINIFEIAQNKIK